MSGSTNPEATLQANKQVAIRFFQAVQSGDVAALEALLAPDFHWWVLSWGARTREAFLDGLRRTISTFPERTLTVTGITAEGERVAVEAVAQFARPGLSYRNAYHQLFIVRDGRIASGKEYLDTAAAAAAFGLTLGNAT